MLKLRAILIAFCSFVCTLGYTQEFRVYFGNLHSHTSYSDGSGTPHEAFRHARDAAKMDFLAITEHNHVSAESGASADRKDGILIAKDPTLYNGLDQLSLIQTAKAMTEDGKFIALYGQEFSSISKGNHTNVFDAPELIDVPNGAFDQLLSWIKSHPDTTGQSCVLQFNHPRLFKKPSAYGRDDFDSEAKWVREMGSVVRLIEVLNGPAMTKTGGERAAEVADKDYQKYLLKGFKLAPTGDQDNHYFTWGTATDTRTGVIIDGHITKKKLLEALRSRHVYATEDKNLAVIFRINGHLCGDELPAPSPNSVLSIEFSIDDADESATSYDVDVIRGIIGGTSVEIVETVSVITESEQPPVTWTVDSVQYTGGNQFFYLAITQHDEDGGTDRVWTAPVWFLASPNLDSAEPGVPTPNATIVASKRSNVFHTSPDCEFAKKILATNRITGEAARNGRKQCLKCKELEHGQ